MNVIIKRLNKNAKLPFRATEGSAGADLFACLDEEILLLPGERRLIPTGLAAEIPEGFGGFVFPRSSVASKYGVTLSNCVGVIDSDYRGELKIAVVNLGTEPFSVKCGDRIAQLSLMPIEPCGFVEADELGETVRGVGGFGSTGKN